MSLKSSNKVSNNEYEVEVAIPPEEFNKEVDKIYKRDIKKINVPGFRVGKAPRAFVEKYYGENVFHEDAVKNIYPKAVEDAAKELNIEVVDVNKLDVVTSSKSEGLVFKAKLIIIPEIRIGKYKGIEVNKIDYEVSDADLEKEIEEVRIKNGRLVTVENRPAKIGDSVVIDFEGFINDEPFEGGQATNFTLELGKNQFIKGFEEQIEGHNTGEEFEIKVKFPDDYHAKQYAGKDAVFKLKLYEIKERELPDIDDEFVKDISEFDTLNEYKENLKKELADKKKNQADADQENEVVDKLTKLVESDIPEVMIDRKLNEITQDFKYRLEAQGIKFEDYQKYMGTEFDKMNDNFKSQAETQVKLSLALRKIAEVENIECSQEDIDNEYKNITEHYKMDIDKVKSIVSIEDIEKDVKSKKAMDIVKNNLVIKE